MKVICIASVRWCRNNETNLPDKSPEIFIGSFYTPIETRMIPYNGSFIECYALEEIPPDVNNHWYATRLFATCSDIDETTISITKEEVAHQ